MKLGNQIEKVLSADIDGFTIELKFKDGTTGTVSLSHIFGSPKNLSAELLRAGIFEQCFVEAGALAWPNGFELCPDSLYHLIKEQE